MDFNTHNTLNIDSLLADLQTARSSGLISEISYQNASRWLTLPELAEFRLAVADAIGRAAWAEIDAAFWESIPFGTGGRRGTMGAFGTALINTRTIAESALGLAVYARKSTGKPRPRVVIAYDTRCRSEE